MKKGEKRKIVMLRFSNICKPEEGWYGQPKYCYEKQYTLFQISFEVVFGLPFFGSLCAGLF